MKLFESVGGIEVYVNEMDQIVIKQDDVYGDEPDYVFIPRIFLQVVIDALQAEVEGQ